MLLRAPVPYRPPPTSKQRMGSKGFALSGVPRGRAPWPSSPARCQSARQILTQAMDAVPVREAIVRTLREELHPAGIVERVEARIRELEQLPALPSGLLWGEKSSSEFRMNGIGFHYDGREGQKTGAFLDQRENYAAAAQYAHGEALDAFCYQGGFALHMAEKCSSVTGVDSSRPALEMAEKNATLNGRELEWMEANAFDLLREYAAAGRHYDTVVLDPPAFAKKRSDVTMAAKGYREINRLAIQKMPKGSLLLTCSCSSYVDPGLFQQLIFQSAFDAQRTVRILGRHIQAPDHPVSIYHPEWVYLKSLLLYIH